MRGCRLAGSFAASVACARGICPKAFSRQWTALVQKHKGAIGVLALHREFQRVAQGAAKPTAWVEQSLAYLDQTPREFKGKAVSRDRLWVVVQGYGVSGSRAARRPCSRHSFGSINRTSRAT
jgi:hypothetical protein